MDSKKVRGFAPCGVYQDQDCPFFPCSPHSDMDCSACWCDFYGLWDGCGVPELVEYVDVGGVRVCDCTRCPIRRASIVRILLPYLSTSLRRQVLSELTRE